MRPTARDILRARRTVAAVARRTPLQHSAWLSGIAGRDVYLKLECWQRTNSFKVRGAYNAIAGLDEETRRRGLVTASAGNHGQAVALAAREFGARATIFVPLDAPETKKARIRSFGGALRETGDTYDEAAVAARTFAREEDAHYVHAFSDPAVVAGQATVGLEILEELPDVGDVLVPVGGGGLVAGIGIALRALAPDARTWGIQTTATSSMYDAFRAGGVVESPVGATLCDGLAGEVEEASYRRAREVVEDMALVEEASVPRAIRELFRHEVVAAEGAGAVGIAALLNDALELGDAVSPIVVVVSGGNIDARRLGRIFSED
ncbi:MAG TPA: threonine/serine dehydratase [Longimicrobiales bacterium]|nr:threonine/serine dehydratase [Longimicrobiales bacterium]